MEELKRRIKEIEAEILAITGVDYEVYNGWADSAQQRNHVEALLKSRCELLNRMFIPTAKTLRVFRLKTIIYETSPFMPTNDSLKSTQSDTIWQTLMTIMKRLRAGSDLSSTMKTLC